MNLIFKIVENCPDTEQFIVKYSRQNSLISIDDRRAYAIDYQHIDFTSYENFVTSVMKAGRSVIIKQFEEEVGIESNYNVEITDSAKIEDNLNKIIPLPYEDIIYYGNYNLNKIDLS
jgi:hypothetical protein